MWRLLIAVEVGLIAYAFACVWFGAWFGDRVAEWFERHPKGLRIRFTWWQQTDAPSVDQGAKS